MIKIAYIALAVIAMMIVTVILACIDIICVEKLAKNGNRKLALAFRIVIRFILVVGWIYFAYIESMARVVI